MNVRYLAWIVVLVLCCGCEEPHVVIEDETPDVITIIEHIWHVVIEEDSTPDVIIEEDSTPDVIVLEDNTPDVIQEFYSDAADLPVFVWEDQGGAPPMPKKFSDLVAATVLNDGDLFAITQAGTSKKLTPDLIKQYLGLSPRYGHVDHTEWLTTDPAGEQGWANAVSGTNAEAVIGGLGVSSRPGSHLFLETGTTATGRACIYRADLVAGIGIVRFELGLYLSALSDGSNTFTVYAGLGDDVLGSDHDDGVYFRYSHGLSSGNWERCTAASASRTQESTGIAAAATTWTTLAAEINAGASSVDFFIDGAAAGTITTNVPTGYSERMKPQIKIVKSVGTTERYVAVDFYQLLQTFTTPR